MLELKKKAEQSRLESEYEDALVQEEECTAKNLDDKELSELPIDRVNDRVARLDQNMALNDQEVVVDKPPIVEKVDVSNPEGATNGMVNAQETKQVPLYGKS